MPQASRMATNRARIVVESGFFRAWRQREDGQETRFQAAAGRVWDIGELELVYVRVIGGSGSVYEVSGEGHQFLVSEAGCGISPVLDRWRNGACHQCHLIQTDISAIAPSWHATSPGSVFHRPLTGRAVPRPCYRPEPGAGEGGLALVIAGAMVTPPWPLAAEIH